MGLWINGDVVCLMCLVLMEMDRVDSGRFWVVFNSGCGCGFRYLEILGMVYCYFVLCMVGFFYID